MLNTDIDIEIKKSISIGQRVIISVLVIAAMATGVTIALGLFALNKSIKSRQTYWQILQNQPVAALAKPAAPNDEFLIKFNQGVSEESQNQVINEVVSKTRKFAIKESTGGIIPVEEAILNVPVPGKDSPVIKEVASSMVERESIAANFKDSQAIKNKYPERSKRALAGASLSDEPGSWQKVKLDKVTNVAEIISELKDKKEVKAVDFNYPVSVFLEPNDPYYHSSGTWGQPYDDQWSYKKINTAGAWDSITGSADVTVAVVDTGLDFTHEDINGMFWTNNDEIPDNSMDDDGNGYVDDVRGWNYVNGNNDPTDDFGHGTHVSGTIGAATNNSIGVAGINWQVKIMTIKTFDANGSGDLYDCANGIYYAVNNGADIINMSWGGQGLIPSILADALAYAHDLGVVLVASAGNSNADVTEFFPTGHPDVITVAATDYQDNKASFSNYGVGIDVAAPGVDVLSLRSAINNMCDVNSSVGKYCHVSGTSMAAPHVAGTAALLIAKNTNLTEAQIRAAIQLSADDLGDPGRDQYFGYGRINASSAVNANNFPQLPYARIDFPNRSFEGISGLIDVTGTAIADEFDHYTLEISSGYYSESWQEIYSSQTSVINGLLYSWDTSSFSGPYFLRLKVYSSNNLYYPEQDQFLVFFDNINPNVTNHSGWPINTNQKMSASIAVSDIDPAYPGLEIIVGSTANKVFVWHQDGTAVSGWPKTTNGAVYFSAAVGDINNDNKLEIIASDFAGYVYIWDSAGNLLPGWPTMAFSGTSPGRTTAPSLVDLDKDGYPEIAVGSGDGKLYVWRYNGSGYLNSNGVFATTSGVFNMGLATGDINGDSYPEIARTSWDGLFVWDKNGQPLPGFPKSGNYYVNSIPLLVDVNKDGKLEIFAIIHGSGITAWNYQGNGLISPDGKFWGDNIYFRHLSAGDLDGDGDFEIFAGNDGSNTPMQDNNIYAFHHNGSIVAGWPTNVWGMATQQATLMDINGDNQTDLVMGMGSLYFDVLPQYLKIYALNSAGTSLPGWPVFIDGLDKSHTWAAITGADIDNDEKLELLLSSWNGQVYVLDTSAPLNSTKTHQWPRWQHDNYNTNRYHDLIPQAYRPQTIKEALINELMSNDILHLNPTVRFYRGDEIMGELRAWNNMYLPGAEVTGSAEPLRVELSHECIAPGTFPARRIRINSTDVICLPEIEVLNGSARKLYYDDQGNAYYDVMLTNRVSQQACDRSLAQPLLPNALDNAYINQPVKTEDSTILFKRVAHLGFFNIATNDFALTPTLGKTLAIQFGAPSVFPNRTITVKSDTGEFTTLCVPENSLGLRTIYFSSDGTPYDDETLFIDPLLAQSCPETLKNGYIPYDLTGGSISSPYPDSTPDHFQIYAVRDMQSLGMWDNDNNTFRFDGTFGTAISTATKSPFGLSFGVAAKTPQALNIPARNLTLTSELGRLTLCLPSIRLAAGESVAYWYDNFGQPYNDIFLSNKVTCKVKTEDRGKDKEIVP